MFFVPSRSWGILCFPGLGFVGHDGLKIQFLVGISSPHKYIKRHMMAVLALTIVSDLKIACIRYII
jgi:hypothetical protein